jgi:hypothetical protein
MIQLSDLIEGAKNCVDNAAKIKPGEEVLILSDTTVDPDVVNAYRIAAELAGGNVSVLTLKSRIAGAGPNKILDEGYFVPWPKMAWHAMVAANVCLNLSYFIEVHSLFGAAQTQWVEQFMDLKKKYGTRLVRVQISVKETLASAYARYPQPLIEFIGVSAFRQVMEAIGIDFEKLDISAATLEADKAEVKLTDLEGTDLCFKGLQFTSGWKWKVGGEKDEQTAWKDFGSYNVGLQPSDSEPNANGVIVTSALHTGPIPQMKITVRDGKGVNIEGGGAVGLRWLRDWEKNSHVMSTGRVFAIHKRPGINWLEEVMYATHPKAFRVGEHYMYSGTEADHSWFTGSRRSGTLHMAFGGGVGPKLYKHRDVEIFWPTLIVNKTTIIDKGHLKILDDPKVRKEAEKYGDPDELLTEDWIPEIPSKR